MLGFRRLIRSSPSISTSTSSSRARSWLTRTFTSIPLSTATATATRCTCNTASTPTSTSTSISTSTSNSRPRGTPMPTPTPTPQHHSHSHSRLFHTSSAARTPSSAAAPVAFACASAASVPAPPLSSTFASWASSPEAVAEWRTLNIGQVYHGWILQHKQHVSELSLTAYRLLDPVTGAAALHVERDDPDQAFCVAFRTPPKDSTGVAHILEHTVLCGSVHFPVRDPFFLLLRRSLKTFMNAMTASDYTMYPFSTLNTVDYYNLLSVYLSTTFFPLLKRTDFQQEGHRFEFQTPDDSNSQLIYKGVVYNEMKGAMSDTDQLFAQQMQSALFTKNVYHHNSGGDPCVIPSLTHSDLISFHRSFYHPSNAMFMSYGPATNVPPLAYIRTFILNHANTINTNGNHTTTNNNTNNTSNTSASASAAASTRYEPEPAWSEPRRQHATCPPDPLVPDENKQTKICVAYVCHDGLAPLAATSTSAQSAAADEIELERFAMHILSLLLTDGPLAPMYQALIDSGLGSGYLLTGYDTSTIQPVMSFGLQGIAASDADRVEQLILSTLERAATDGFPSERIDALLHQMEIGVKHITSHFGVNLLTSMAGNWAHHRDPIVALEINRRITSLQTELSRGPYFQQLIQKYLLNNKHRITYIMSPDPDYHQQQSNKERQILDTIQAQLSDADKTKIVNEAAQLKSVQDTPTDASCLPTLRVSDISPKAEPVQLETLTVPTPTPTPTCTSTSTPLPSATTTNTSTSTSASAAASASAPVKVSFLDRPTNGMGYIRLAVDSRRIPPSLKPYLPLYTSFVTSMGAGSLSYRSLSHEMDAHTGGISAELRILTSLHHLQQHQEFVVFKGVALQRKISQMMKLLQIITTQPNFNDLARLKILITNGAASLSSSLQDSGHSYARSDAAQHLSPAAALNELVAGITHVKFVNSLVSNLSDDVLLDISRKLQEISQILFKGGVSRSFLVGDSSTLHTFERELPSFFSATTTSSATSLFPSCAHVNGHVDVHVPLYEPAFTPQTGPRPATFYATPIQVNHVSMVVPTVNKLHPDAPKLDILSSLMSRIYLHTEIREKGGAYGGGSSHSGDGIFAFYSYRDPGCESTLAAYERAIEWAQQGQFTQQQIDESLLDLFSHIDAPIAPSNQGVREFLSGISTEQRQAYRDALLSTTKQSLVDVAHRYFSESRVRDAAAVTVIGSQQATPNMHQQHADTQTQTQGVNTRTWLIRPLELAMPMSSDPEARQFQGEEGEVEGEEDDEHDEEENGDDDKQHQSNVSRSPNPSPTPSQGHVH